ncbi:MAG: hypothetical protein R3C61_20920 [Bacteroidia bacterium]
MTLSRFCTRFCKYISGITVLILCLINSPSLHAQSFWGYQTIGSHTVFFSVAWQGKKTWLGAGYIYRDFGKTFTDLSAEIRFPLAEMYKFDNYQVIAGVYKPTVIKRAFMGTAAHIRIKKGTSDSQETTQVQLALTVLPSYTYAASLNDGIYGTTGLRITYAPVLWASVKEGGNAPSTQALAAHKLELGGHFDLHSERTLGLSLNGYVVGSFIPQKSILPQQNRWTGEGDFYWGMTYPRRKS